MKLIKLEGSIKGFEQLLVALS